MKYGHIARARVDAIRRRALKRWLRRHGIAYASRDMYSESALRKLVRDNADEVKEADRWLT